MNKLIIALSLACASACVFAADNATPTPYNDLKLNEPTAWFSATAENDQVKLGGLSKTGDGLKAEGDMLVVETDADTMAAVTLTATDAATEDITTVTLDMSASTVPSESLKGKDTMSAKGKIAFAIAGDDDNRGFRVWLGGDSWEHLIGADAPADEASYKLVVRFDGRQNVNKVSFEVVINSIGTVLKKTSETTDDGWYGYGAEPVAKAVAVDLIGSGKIASITGSQISIQAEVIDVGGLGKVVIPEEIASRYEATDPVPGSCKVNVNVATAVALGLMKVEDGEVKVDNTTDFTVKADATAKYSDAIPVVFPNFNPANVPNTTVISYQLMGSTDGTDNSYTDVGAAVSNIADVKIPQSAINEGKRYFKVVTKVEVNDPNKL